ncbi:ABC transporter substrate-binding protein [Hydrogenophaga sp. BPS33]|uniref:ABC transporter substrate-binding protein n=1 Tax=Hydrogenophaga sp. BPS33 TaxID=2651974 RepID=UPI00135B5453|nr:ABC transporter substrate-binding protein [Hydrogenophaga sp. BPS33]
MTKLFSLCRPHVGVRWCGRMLAVLGIVFGLQPVLAQPSTDLCSKVDLQKTPVQPVTIRYGLTGGGEEPLALLWADKEKYPHQGKFYVLDHKLFAPNDRMTAVQAGQLDAGSISLTALITAVRVGIDVRAVAPVVETNATDNQGAFVVLKDSGLTDIKQLKGKRIGFYGPNTVSEYWIKSALRRAGLKPNDVSYVSMPPPAQEQALRNKQIDVAWLARQFLAKAGATGGVDVLMRPMQATAQAHPSTLAFFTQKFVKEQPQAYCAWRADYQRALANWAKEREASYPKLIAAGYLTPAAANAGADGGRAEGGKIALKDIDDTMEDMVEADFLPRGRNPKAVDMVLSGYALVR